MFSSQIRWMLIECRNKQWWRVCWWITVWGGGDWRRVVHSVGIMICTWRILGDVSRKPPIWLAATTTDIKSWAGFWHHRLCGGVMVLCQQINNANYEQNPNVCNKVHKSKTEWQTKKQSKRAVANKAKSIRIILTNVDNRRTMPRLQINTYLLTKWAYDTKQCWQKQTIKCDHQNWYD